MKQEELNRKQGDVTEFYDVVFPSHSSDARYLGILEKFDLKIGQRVGDFGCGGGLFKKPFKWLGQKGVNTVYVDISSKVLLLLNGNRIRSDIQMMGIRSETFDLILLIGVLHHLPNMELALKELPSGKYVLIQV